MFTTPATHFRAGWGPYITTLTSGMGSKQSTTHIFPWAVLILQAGARMATAQPCSICLVAGIRARLPSRLSASSPTRPTRLQPFLSWPAVQKSSCSGSRARWRRAWHGDSSTKRVSPLQWHWGTHQRLQEAQEWLGEVWHKGLFKTLMPSYRWTFSWTLLCGWSKAPGVSNRIISIKPGGPKCTDSQGPAVDCPSLQRALVTGDLTHLHSQTYSTTLAGSTGRPDEQTARSRGDILPACARLLLGCPSCPAPHSFACLQTCLQQPVYIHHHEHLGACQCF